ncbi:protein MAIN-LIKE 1-like [Arachis hypogaea]|uniref:protein MAIN-LIKE 1-like n=1 Tax=Arachis hypogaea TaxID=3818 RepID=UPI003B20BE61
MLTCDHLVPPDRYDDRVEAHLRFTDFYHASQIGIVQCQKALVNALVERWHPDTHTFHLPVGECAVTLEDVALILGLPTDGLPVTGMTISSFEALEAECLHQFGVAPRKSDCRGSCIKLTWLRDLKERLQLTDKNSIQRYVKCHIMLLIGTILFGGKYGASVHWKFLPLLSDFGSIGQYSWGSACLAHLYRALCRASRYDCKEIDGPLTLLLVWAFIRMPYLAPVPREPRSFPLANRQAFDDLQEGHFVWVAYAVDRVDPDIIPAEIYMHSVVWSATVPLVSFECVEWHATDRLRRQFGFIQGVPNQEPNLDKAHGKVLTGPKNLNWVTATSHSVWVMQWTNRYHHVLTELPMPPQNSLDIYIDWYRNKYGHHLRLSDLVVQENDEGDEVMNDADEGNEANEENDDLGEEQLPQSPTPPPPPPPPEEQPQSSNQYVPQTQFTSSYPIHQQYWGGTLYDSGEGGSFSQLLGFMAADAGQSHYGYQYDIMAGRYSLDARFPGITSSGASGGLVSGDSSRSEGGRGVLNSRNHHRVSMSQIEKNAQTLDKETDEYLVDEPDDEEDDETDEAEASRNDASDYGDDAGEARTPEETEKSYNLRIDPPRRSANRYTPSVFKKAAKKCKKLVNDVK